MRIGIISDIHSNLEALAQSLAALERSRPERVFCLGDVVGYGASVNECCDLVRKVSEVMLLGNHDAAVSGRMDYSFYYDAARHALDWTASRIRPDHRLHCLPREPSTEHGQGSEDVSLFRGQQSPCQQAAAEIDPPEFGANDVTNGILGGIHSGTSEKD